MGCGSAQVLKNLEIQQISRIADGADFRYESETETAGGTPLQAGRI